MPEKALKKLNSFILPQWKVCFFAALITGVISHLYKITNWLPNWDSLVFRYDAQNMISLGRWFLPVVCAPSSFYDLPFLNGILAILFHALGAVVICKTLGVQKKMTALLIGAVIATFPTVTSVMMYNYVADGYAIAFFLATLAAMFITAEKPKYILSAILIALTVGAYQAYITVTITIVVLVLLDDLIYSKAKISKVLKKGLCILATGVCGMGLYYAMLKLALLVFSINLVDYQGFSSTVEMSNIDIAGSFYVIKETFFKFFFDLSKGLNVYVVLNFIAFAFVLFHCIRRIVKDKMFKEPLRILSIAILAVILITGSTVLAFINVGIDYHNLMLMGYASFYILLLMIYEKDEDAKYNLIKSWAIFIIATAIIANQIVIANISYHKAQIAYEKSYGTLVRMADMIDKTENTSECDRILVLGAIENSEAYSSDLPPDITGITDGYILRADDETVGQSVLCSALNDYCGRSYGFVSGEEKINISEREDVKAMPVWPQKGCIAVVDDVIVIKLEVNDK